MPTQPDTTNFGKIQLDKEPPISSADAPDASSDYDQEEVQAISNLLNEIKAKLNTIFKGE